MIELTETAKNQIEKLCNDNNVFAITLGLKGGGCAGFEYDWDSVKTQEELEENSTIIEAGEGNFAVEPMSLLYLMGSVIDYKSSIIGSQFEVDNPMSKSSCGCGVSVNIDMDKVAEIDTSKIVEVK